MVDFATALAAISTGVQTLRELGQIEKEFDKAALKLKVAELAGALASAQLALVEAQREASASTAEIEKLKDNFRRRATLVDHRGFQYDAGADGQPQGEPYCRRCVEQDGALMRLTPFGKGIGALRCPQCKAEFHSVTTFLYDHEPR